MHKTTALLLVDEQNDFFPGGVLAVPEGDQVVGPLNRAVERFVATGLPVFINRDCTATNPASPNLWRSPWPPTIACKLRSLMP